MVINFIKFMLLGGTKLVFKTFYISLKVYILMNNIKIYLNILKKI